MADRLSSECREKPGEVALSGLHVIYTPMKIFNRANRGDHTLDADIQID